MAHPLYDVTAFEIVDDYTLRITFDDGATQIVDLKPVLSELTEYENEVLYPLATQQVEIDLDDGVKVNYSKFGKALKRVSGLSQ